MEFNAIVSGEATSKNTPFSGDDWDLIFAGNQKAFDFYQTFIAFSDKGYGPVPIYVSDQGVPYGALAVETTRDKIVINGVDKSTVRPCDRPNDPRPL